jgi:hypothetical protein
MILPDAETILTEEYWEPIPPMPEYKHHGQIGRMIEAFKAGGPWLLPAIESSVKQRTSENLALGVSYLLAGEPTEAIPEGAAIGTREDFRYSLPGAVVLVDTEYGIFNGGISLFDKDNMPEAEIGLSATACLAKNLHSTDFSDPSDNYDVLNGYRKTWTTPGLGKYIREIDIYAFCATQKGETIGLGMIQWRNEPAGPTAKVLSGRIANTKYMPRPPRVAETINETLVDTIPSYTRIREARLCIAGVWEYAKAKTERRRLTLPRLVPSIAPAGAYRSISM